MSDESHSESRGAAPQAGVRLDPKNLDEAVHAALRRIPHDRPLIGPILVGIIAYPEGGKIKFKDIQAGPQG